MKELLERLMADAKASVAKAPPVKAQIEIKLELTGPISKRLNQDLKDFGETTPASIAMCLITQLERESQIRETLADIEPLVSIALPPDELKQFKEWQDRNIKLLRAAITHCVNMIGA